MKWTLEFVCIALLAANLAAQSGGRSAELRSIDVVANGDELRVVMTLSSPADAKVIPSKLSQEIIVALNGAVPAANLGRVARENPGIKSVRVASERGNSPVTRITVIVDKMRPYGLAVDGNNITLRLVPLQSSARRRAPVPAAKSSGLASLRRNKQDVNLPLAGAPPVELTSPPSYPPIASPQASSAAAATSADAPSATTADSFSPAEDMASSSAASEPARGIHLSQPNADIPIAFKVKYVVQGVAYLEGGRSVGLAEGSKLFVRDTDPTTGRPIQSSDGEQKAVAELDVFAIAETSAASEIHDAARAVKPGDWAFLSSEETASLVAQRSLSATRKYPVVVSFTEDDPLDEEARTEVPRPPLPEVNRSRGRIGFDYTGFMSHGSGGGSSSNLGLVVRTDVTRINGTYWNLSGYWRGRISSRSSQGQPTLQDLINRTYHLSLTYDNPNSHWVIGAGRLYLPWATSLDTIDGGYFGRKVGKSAVVGVFGGSTPDPTSWSYNPGRHIMGSFFNVEGGDFDNVRYSSTSGAGVSMLNGNIDRPFVFFENTVTYKHNLSLYHALQADSPRGNSAVPAPGAGIGRSFLTLRVQPYRRLEFNFNHTYFRDLPTFDPQLIGTGLLDKYLFQGFSAGARVEVAKSVLVYTNLGQSNRSGDAKPSLNQMFGVTFGHVPWANVTADFRYSKFDGSFGGGTYKTLTLSRNFRENVRWEFLAGTQSFASAMAKSTSSHFFTGNFETNLGSNYFLQSSYTYNRGGLQNYDQWSFTFGYRFDSRSKRGR